MKNVVTKDINKINWKWVIRDHNNSEQQQLTETFIIVMILTLKDTKYRSSTATLYLKKLYSL